MTGVKIKPFNPEKIRKLKKKKKQRGYGQASEGRTRKQSGSLAKKIAWEQQRPAARISSGGPYATGRPHKVAGFGTINPNEPTNVRKKRPGGFSKGGRVGKFSGGVASRLSKAGPVAKPN